MRRVEPWSEMTGSLGRSVLLLLVEEFFMDVWWCLFWFVPIVVTFGLFAVTIEEEEI